MDANSSTKVNSRPIPKFLTLEEVESLFKAARKYSRYPDRDVAILRLMFGHGLRVSELCNLERASIIGDCEEICIHRLKADAADVQALSPLEAKALRKYLKLKRRVDTRQFLFLTERGSQFSRQGVHRMVKAMGRHAGLGSVHPHRLRHACGYHLVNQGEPMRFIQSYLGHKTEAMTLLYTQLSARKYDSIRTHFK
jgi:site-specific recombinase XerD